MAIIYKLNDFKVVLEQGQKINMYTHRYTLVNEITRETHAQLGKCDAHACDDHACHVTII